MAKWLRGEVVKRDEKTKQPISSKIVWHRVDEKGPDKDRVKHLQPPNLLSFHKTVCGKHYGADAVESEGPPKGSSFGVCSGC